MYSYGSPHMAAQKQGDQLERTFSSYVRIQDVVLKTYLGRWTIGRSGERGSGISVLPARYDDDDDDRIKNMRFTIKENHNTLLHKKMLKYLLESTYFGTNTYWYCWFHSFNSVYTHAYIYIYIYIQRERERERESQQCLASVSFSPIR